MVSIKNQLRRGRVLIENVDGARDRLKVLEEAFVTNSPQLSERLLLNGDVYHSGIDFEDSVAGDEVFVVLENPPESNTFIVLLENTVSLTVKFIATKYENVDITNKTEAENLVNKNSGHENSSIGNVFVGGYINNSTISGGNEYISVSAGEAGGSGARSPGRIGESGFVNVIPPGSNVAIQLQNDDGDDESYGSIIINWAEVDEDVVDLLQ